MYYGMIQKFHLWITNQVQKVPRLCLFFNSSRCYGVTGLPTFLFVLSSPLTQNYHYAVSVLFLIMLFFYKYDWTILY